MNGTDATPPTAGAPMVAAMEAASSPAPAPAAPVSAPSVPAAPGAPAYALGAAIVLAVLGLLTSVLLWQKLSHIQEQLARQSAEASSQAAEARATARQAQELVRETAARQSVADARLGEVSLQRGQLEDLMQSLSRSRDENLVVDIESAVRLAQQQAQLTGSVEPLLAALRTANERIQRAAQPRLAPVQRALAHDLERVKAATVTDTPGVLIKLEELTRLADELPLVASTPAARAVAHEVAIERPAAADGVRGYIDKLWRDALASIGTQLTALVRVSRIDQPEAALLAPEQGYLLRQNLRFLLINARLGVLARQNASAQADLAASEALIRRYFDPASRKARAALELAQQLRGQMRSMELPRLDETLTALTTAAAGR